MSAKHFEFVGGDGRERDLTVTEPYRRDENGLELGRIILTRSRIIERIFDAAPRLIMPTAREIGYGLPAGDAPTIGPRFMHVGTDNPPEVVNVINVENNTSRPGVLGYLAATTYDRQRPLSELCIEMYCRDLSEGRPTWYEGASIGMYEGYASVDFDYDTYYARDLNPDSHSPETIAGDIESRILNLVRFAVDLNRMPLVANTEPDLFLNEDISSLYRQRQAV